MYNMTWFMILGDTGACLSGIASKPTVFTIYRELSTVMIGSSDKHEAKRCKSYKFCQLFDIFRYFIILETENFSLVFFGVITSCNF